MLLTNITTGRRAAVGLRQTRREARCNRRIKLVLKENRMILVVVLVLAGTGLRVSDRPAGGLKVKVKSDAHFRRSILEL